MPASNGQDVTVKIPLQPKIVSWEVLRSIVISLQRDGCKVVFTNGCFDLIHTGHTRYLQAARQAGDCLVVGVNSDHSVRQLKGDKRPILPLAERMEILAGFGFVDYVVSFEETDPYRLIQTLRPNILVKGGDWSIDRIIGRELVEAEGGSVFTVPEIKGHSTTQIIERILQRYAH